MDESYAAGKAAVENAVAGVTDKMVGFERVYVDGKYTCKIKLFPLDRRGQHREEGSAGVDQRRPATA